MQQQIKVKMNKPYKKNKALFLDRDGTLNAEKNYVYKIQDFEFLPGILDLLQHFQQKGFLLIVVTNQSGIARGFYTEKDFLLLTNWMIAELKKQKVNIAKVYFCPHHPDFSGDCNCRKPKPGLILEAIKEFNLNPRESILVGDKDTDILAGINAGIGKNLYIHDLINQGKFQATELF